jgi:hypothetical protein
MDPNVVLPLGSAVLSLVFAILLIDQWRERRRPYQLIWAIGMLWYGLSAGTEFLGGFAGWNETLYRTWYLIGAIWLVGWLGLGTLQLLRRTRFGYVIGVVTVLAALAAVGGRSRYPDAGIAPIFYGVVGIAIGIALLYLTRRGSDRWADLAALGVLLITLTGAFLTLALPFAAPGWAVDPITHIPTPEKVPGDLRLLAAIPNITGATSLILGALYSAYVFMPKRRIIRYTLSGQQGRSQYVVNLARAFVAIPLNFVASIPAAYGAARRGELNSRVPATLLIALGALIPGVTSGLQRFGVSTAFFVGELLGVILLFAGYLASVEVIQTIRVPFTRIVFRARQLEA